MALRRGRTLRRWLDEFKQPRSARGGALKGGVVFYIESRRFLIRDSPRPATPYPHGVVAGLDNFIAVGLRIKVINNSKQRKRPWCRGAGHSRAICQRLLWSHTTILAHKHS